MDSGAVKSLLTPEAGLVGPLAKYRPRGSETPAPAADDAHGAITSAAADRLQESSKQKRQPRRAARAGTAAGGGESTRAVRSKVAGSAAPIARCRRSFVRSTTSAGPRQLACRVDGGSAADRATVRAKPRRRESTTQPAPRHRQTQAMELTLERSDLCQVGTISHLNTLALTEDKKSGRLRIVVGDDNGDVQAFEVKRGDAKSIFKTSAGKGGVQAVCTGGGKVKDRVFCAVGQVVVGLGRKGKQFFSLQSSLVEPIRFLSVDEALFFTGGEYAHSRYRDGADDGFYTCPDRITAMHVQRFGDQHHVFLGCKDQTYKNGPKG